MFKRFVFVIIVFGFLFGIKSINYNKSHYNTKIVNYNGNNLRISIDGELSNTLPTSGVYYLSDYSCKSSNTKVTWNKDAYELEISNGNKRGGLSCNLEFKSTPLLSKMPVGSYVAYTGNNGCVGISCNGYNANYVSDTDMGYCVDYDAKFYVNGWRIGYIENDSAYLVSAGAPECMCTNSDGTSSNSVCDDNLAASVLYKHYDNLDAVSLKYCNSNFSKNGVCDSSTAWAMDATDFRKITGSILSSGSCYEKYSTMSCGYNNDLIDNGGYYWFATSYSTSSVDSFDWLVDERIVSSYSSDSVEGVRPVLYLDSSVFVVGGSGTYEDPYQISND